jgi:hypothetical protein
MRVGGAAVVVLALAAAGAAGPATFVDVPPWHWAYDAVQQGAAAGIFTGYPATDPELVANALTQVYDAFAHPAHPLAMAWAEEFLRNLPASWPQPLLRSRLRDVVLSDIEVRVQGDRATVRWVAVVTVRADGPARTRVRAEAVAVRDPSGRWRIDYAALAAAHPQVFGR